MRYIDIEDLRVPDGWTERATAAKDAVMKGADPDDYAGIWRELKNELAALLNDKCWYCESPIDRSDNAVDHFRPKKRVSDAAKLHAGYRWLAFKYANFRYSCTYCNSKRKDLIFGTTGGKADRFPLLDETKRVYVEGNTDDESPAILDPCDMDDCELVGCKQENGNPYAASNDDHEKLRAELSIEIYHLDYQPTCKRRHQHIVELLSFIESAKELYLKVSAGACDERIFKQEAKKIERKIKRDADYSGDMRFVLRGHRSTAHPWIQKLLEV